jgi:hypothetical protein
MALTCLPGLLLFRNHQHRRDENPKHEAPNPTTPPQADASCPVSFGKPIANPRIE